MRKFLLVVLAILCLGVFIIQNNNTEEEIRVRIIPNGNSEKDLEEKKEAKNIVLCYLEMIFDESYEVCLSNIDQTYKELEKSLEKKFIDVSVSFGKHTLYNKTYNDNAIKNTKTYTLYIVLGNGDGDNWWGSIYPEFLSVSGDTEYKYESLLVNVLKKIKEN